MKRLLAVLLVLLTFTGCKNTGSGMNRAMVMRDKLLKSSGCSFTVNITADYGEKFYTFVMNCTADQDGAVQFEVVSPESIAGIRGCLSGEGGKLTFDDQVLMFEMLADGQITPVSSPWILMRTLRSGYINGCGAEADGLRLQIDDSYEEDTLHLEIRTDNNDLPVYAEIIYKNRRIVSMEVENFKFL